MKIAIVTWQYPNYGTLLQAFALQNVLERQQCDVQILNYENQKKDVTGILIISGQSTSTVSNSIRHAILSKKYTERVKRNWNTQTPHTVSRRLLPSTLRKSDSAC